MTKLADSWDIQKYVGRWYIQEYLRGNFSEKYGKTDPTQLARIAKELMPSLPAEASSWSVGILQIILAEIVGYGVPTILSRKQVAEANFICSNKDSVDTLVAWDQHFNINSSVPTILEHRPDWIIQVVDPMITSAEGIFRFCPVHPNHTIIWQSPAKMHK